MSHFCNIPEKKAFLRTVSIWEFKDWDLGVEKDYSWKIYLYSIGPIILTSLWIAFFSSVFHVFILMSVELIAQIVRCYEIKFHIDVTLQWNVTKYRSKNRPLRHLAWSGWIICVVVESWWEPWQYQDWKQFQIRKADRQWKVFDQLEESNYRQAN